MDIVYKQLDELVPYVNNPKKHPPEQIDKIASSIKEFGFRVPLLITGDNQIIAGHGRYEACKKIGKDEVPCIIADDLTDAQIKAYRIADNRIAESEWDWELLNLEISQLQDEINIDILGFEEYELDMVDFASPDDFDEIEDSDMEDSPITKLKCPFCGEVANQDEFETVDED